MPWNVPARRFGSSSLVSKKSAEEPSVTCAQMLAIAVIDIVVFEAARECPHAASTAAPTSSGTKSKARFQSGASHEDLHPCTGGRTRLRGFVSTSATPERTSECVSDEQYRQQTDACPVRSFFGCWFSRFGAGDSRARKHACTPRPGHLRVSPSIRGQSALTPTLPAGCFHPKCSGSRAFLPPKWTFPVKRFQNFRAVNDGVS